MYVANSFQTGRNIMCKKNRAGNMMWVSWGPLGNSDLESLSRGCKQTGEARVSHATTRGPRAVDNHRGPQHGSTWRWLWGRSPAWASHGTSRAPREHSKKWLKWCCKAFLWPSTRELWTLLPLHSISQALKSTPIQRRETRPHISKKQCEVNIFAHI